MNALALVCNLYADGPRSLQRLREDGRHELADVLELSESRLVELLGMSPRSAERFRREAETLGRRVGNEFLDPDDGAHESERDAGPVPTGLEPGVIDGLDAGTCRSLAEAGVRSVAQLAARDALPLAEATGISFAGIRRLQFLARRGVGALAPTKHDDVIPAARPAGAPLAQAHRAASKVSLAEGPERPVAAAFEDELNRRERDQAAGPFA